MPIHSSVPVPLRDISWTRRAFCRGASVFREGDRAELIYLLDSGLIKLSRDVDSLRKTIVRLVRPGELIGDRALNGVMHQRYTAETLDDGAVWEAGRREFQAVCDASPRALNWVTSQLEQRLAEVERRVELITYERVEIRLLKLLLELAEATVVSANLPAENIQMPLSQWEIAQMIGSTRETASTHLNLLGRRDLLRLSRRQIEVVSLEALREALRSDDRALAAHP